MSLSSHEAAASLSEAEKARQRSARLYVYRKSSPHLVMWGIIWIFGYCGTALSPSHSNWIWGVLMLAGMLGGVVIHRRTRCAADTNERHAWRWFALIAIALFFVMATYTLMWPVHGRQMAAYPVLLTGSIYTAVGLWTGVRYIVTGVVVVALALVGYFYIEPILLWMAFVGGGSMILAGLWFRTV